LREKVTQKSLLFLSSLIASKHSVFPITEVSASEVPVILKEFVSKEATSLATILKLAWQPGCVYVTSLRPTQNWREGEKSAADHDSKRSSISQSSIASFLNVEHVCLKIIGLESR